MATRKSLLLVVFLGISCVLEAQSRPNGYWNVSSERDELHAKDVTVINLAGEYLTAPTGTVPSIRPLLVVRCSDHKVTENFVSFGAVLQIRKSSLFPVMMESRIDGKKGEIGATGLSSDGTAVFFSRSDLRAILKARTVILGADQYLGPEIIVKFDIPTASEILQACGEDRILKHM